MNGLSAADGSYAAIELATGTSTMALGDVACRSDGTCAYAVDGVALLEVRVLGAAPTLGPAPLFTPTVDGVNRASAVAWRGADLSRAGVREPSPEEYFMLLDLR